jgi:hypothetical protein
MFPQAFDDDHLAELVDANSSVPDWVDDPEVLQRIIEHAKGRASGRGEESALDSTEAECLITTDWNSFTDDWGFDDGNANQVALGVFNEEVSSGKQADLFNETVIVQTGWLRTGDGRKSQSEAYLDEGYDNADEGEMWIPNGAQDYIAIIELTDELLHGEVTLADAM